MPEFKEEFSSSQVNSPDIPDGDEEMNTTTVMFPDITTEPGDTILHDISNEVTSVESQTAVVMKSEENFMQDFPAVNFLPTITPSSPTPSPQKKKEKVKGLQNIAGYIIATDETPSRSQDAAEDTQETPTFKRPRDPTDEDLYNRRNKKPRVADENGNEPQGSSLAQTALQPIFGSIMQDEENETDDIQDNVSQFTDFEEGDAIEDVEVDINIASDDMHFPDLEEGIEFNVEAMLKQSNQGNRPLTDKAQQNYVVERRLVLECIKQLYNCLKNAPKGVIEDPDPKGLSVPLMPHQRQAMKWMKWREEQHPCSGGILADEMGLGKTFQMIALIVAVKNEKRKQLLAENPNLYIQEEFDDAEDWGSLDYRQRYEGKTLVVCTPSLMEQWDREIMEKCKGKVLSSFIYHGVENKLASEGKLVKYDVVITTYNTVTMEYKNMMESNDKDSRLFNIHWDRIVLDEAHIIRNHLGKLSASVCELKGKTKWAITGTPIQNKERDFFSLLKYLNCSPFTDLIMWNKWVNNKKALGNKRLIVITKTLMLRRTKKGLVEKGVIKPLPEKHFTTVEVELDKEEQIVYQKLLLYSQSFFMEYLKKKQEKEQSKLFPKRYFSSTSLIAQQVPQKLSRMMRTLVRHHTYKMASDQLLVLIMRLRQACCHPALIKSMLDKEDTDLDDVEGDRDIERMDNSILEYINKVIDEDDNEEADDECDDYDLDDNQARNLMTSDNPLFNDDRKSSKVRAILKTIQDILNVGEKVVVVSQWTSFLQVIGNNLAHMPDAKFAVFSGKTKIPDRQMIVDRINDYDDKLNVLLLSLTAGAVGLNLVGANHLLLIDNHWNPQLELQAQDRLHRFGQHNDVHIYRFVCKDTIEEKITELQKKKLQIASKVLDGKVADNLSINDLASLFS